MKFSSASKNLSLSALFLTLSFFMPLFTAKIPMIGPMLCPVHVIVFLCGYFCGWQWGFTMGFITPLLRSMIFGINPLFPTAICMAFELSMYGLISGISHKLFLDHKLYILGSIFVAIILGRALWGGAMYICFLILGDAVSFLPFILKTYISGIPGAVLQIILTPILVISLKKKLCNKGIA